MHLIGIDVGTTGCKAMVFAADGCVHGRGFREYGVDCGDDGRAEQDVEVVWGAVVEAVREAVGRSGGGRDVVALSVSVQGDAIIPLEATDRPVHPAILGMDYRSAPQARWCEERVDSFRLFERTGMRAHPMNSVTKVLWLRECRPAVFARTTRIVTYADFILGRLGAGAVIDHTMASRTMAFDLAAGVWSVELHRAWGLDPTLWSRPVPSGTVVGTLAPDRATALGLPATVQLVAGGHDQTCAAVGAGVVTAGTGLVSTGTAEVLAAVLDQPVLTRPMYDSFYPCYRHAVPGRFFTFSLNHTAGLLLRWWRDQLASAEVTDARGLGLDPYALIDQRLPVGPSPVMVLPHFHGSGTPVCDVEARGAILGLTLATTRHDIAKAILEALCFELRLNLETLQSAGVALAELVAVGGGARSAAWLQLKADILGRPIRTLRCAEAACLGAAVLAGMGAGVHRSIEEAVSATVARDGGFEPDAGRAGFYDERFARYRDAYPALREFHRQL